MCIFSFLRFFFLIYPLLQIWGLWVVSINLSVRFHFHSVPAGQARTSDPDATLPAYSNIPGNCYMSYNPSFNEIWNAFIYLRAFPFIVCFIKNPIMIYILFCLFYLVEIPRRKMVKLSPFYLFFILFFFLRFYLFMRDTKRQAEGEAGSFRRAWCRTWSQDPRIPGSWPEPKIDTQPLSHPGTPTLILLNILEYIRYFSSDGYRFPSFVFCFNLATKILQ